MIPTIRNALKMATTELSIVSNNVANAGATGFKRADGNFLDHYNESTQRVGLNVGFGVLHEEPRRADNKQGALRVTNNALDLAVSGVGMFMTVNGIDDEVTYTRDGGFSVDNAGRLVTTDKRFVLDNGGEPIRVPMQLVDDQGNRALLDTIQIGDDGKINVTYGDGTIIDTAQIGLARFANFGGLKPIGGSPARRSRLGPNWWVRGRPVHRNCHANFSPIRALEAADGGL